MAPLITEGELSDYLQRPIAPSAALLAVVGASGAVRSHCRWTITQEVDVTLRATGAGIAVLSLPTLELTAVDAVRVDGEELDPTEYRWARRGQLYRKAGWADFASVEVDCTHGYDPAPDVVRIVALGIAARYLSNPEALKIATVGSVQRTYELTNLDHGLLDEFRL